MRGKLLIAAVLLLAAAGGAFAQTEALTAIGALGGGYMYTTYLSIGAIADGHYYKVYDDQTTINLMGELMNLATSAAGSLQVLVKTGTLTPEDFKFVNEIITTLGLLTRQAEGFKTYVETGDENQATVYDSYRNNAWAKIAELLEIKE
jgi:hypothetical protein